VARHVVADCLVINNEFWIFNVKDRDEKYFLLSFYAYNVVKETRTPGAELLSDFDGVHEWLTEI